MRIYHRIKPEFNNLKENDYLWGFGIDTSHYGLVREAREKYNLEHAEKLPVMDDYKQDWDSREGYNIAGAKLNTAYHPLHDVKLYENETGKIYIIDSVHKQHYFGYYILLIIREEGTESHGQAYWENISCKDPTILEGIEEAHKRFTVIK